MGHGQEPKQQIGGCAVASATATRSYSCPKPYLFISGTDDICGNVNTPTRSRGVSSHDDVGGPVSVP